MKIWLAFFRSLGMITQMNILMFILFSLIIIIFVPAQLFNIDKVTSTFKSASDNLIQSSNKIGISNRLQRLVRVSHQLLNLNAQRVQSINLLYNKSFENIGANYTSQALTVGDNRPSYYDFEYLYEKSGNNLYLSNIYYSYSTLSFIITVQNTLIKNGFRGVVGINFDFKKMQTLLSITNDNVLLIYENGTILFQNAFINYSINNQIVSVFDENITGFNKTQWGLLKDSASQSKYNNIILTYNTVFEKQMTINIHKFTNLPYYLMLQVLKTYNRFANLEEDKISKTLSDDTIHSLYQEQISDLSIIGTSHIGLLVLLSISIIIILRPIKRIKWLINHNHSINQANTMFLAKRSNNQLLDLEFNLIKLILRMKKSSMVKSNLCMQLESFRWPRLQQYSQTIEIDALFDTNKMISNRVIISKIRQWAKEQKRRNSGFDAMSEFNDQQNCELLYSFFTTS